VLLFTKEEGELKKKERGRETLFLSLSLSRARLMRACVTPLSLALLTDKMRYRIFIFRVSVKKEQKKTLESQTDRIRRTTTTTRSLFLDDDDERK